MLSGEFYDKGYGAMIAMFLDWQSDQLPSTAVMQHISISVGEIIRS